MQIIINGIPTQLDGALPSEITSCEINADPLTLALIYVQPDQLPYLKKWFNTLIDNCTCEWVIYNNTYYKVDELTKFDLD